jgi:hypothetical protein
VQKAEADFASDCKKRKIGNAFNSISAMLGGRPQGNRDKKKGWSINRDVLDAVLDFAEASQRFQ